VTNEQREEVIRMLKDRLTSNRIASLLGVPRNAVCGIKHRYNMKNAEKIGNTKEVIAAKLTENRIKKRALKWKGGRTPPMKFKKVGPVPAGSKKIHKLNENECKYGVTSHDVPPNQHRFCAKITKDGSAYCEEHHKLCRETVNERKAKSKVFNAGVPVRLLTRFNYS
jgi:hypothetical protein